MHDPLRSWHDLIREEQLDRERIRRVYGRNLILIILSLGAAIAVFLVTRLLLPSNDHGIRNPLEVKIENSLARAITAADFMVSIKRREGSAYFDVTAVLDEPPANPDGLIARIEAIIYDDARESRGDVVIRLILRLPNVDGGEEDAALAVQRTTIEEIRRKLER